MEFIKDIIKENPQIKDVMKVLKIYLKVNRKNSVYIGGIGSYQLFLMVLSVIKSYMAIRVSMLFMKTFEKYTFLILILKELEEIIMIII